MSVVSCLRAGSLPFRSACTPAQCLAIIRREMGGHGPRKMVITPSRWQWHKYKDMLHFYTMLGVIPLGTLVFLVNVFIGPAELAPIPEGYTPKYWEYYSHPISRFLSRYMCTSHQQDYEKYLHFMYDENEKKQIRLTEKKVRDLMSERGDSKAMYYRPILTRYHRMVRDEYEKLEHIRGQ
ncbi:NADH dehydrogenase [ubiquinone] 1 beta subcomplex subunit 5, mitochondrial [Procambarus clarkii]|uniref:NADH dehydrogenase [ubiquinone] 1 beta subcomplex subunit 5, mitochondrial n=1 Tax=Procambarus clarkii TaxID=6728 RepID=UPI001E671863|nr:NADH dehydrogenase [ubiquinone] 1 beta subcomplex subunit 5, mitochondrial-like [Procambarus clarkii]